MQAQIIEFILINFALAMVVPAVFFMLINRLATGNRVIWAEIIFRWLMLFCVGFTGIYAFIVHAYFPMLASSTIGWTESPFQFEVACADLSYGVLGICAFRATSGFRLATVIGVSIWLWGDAVGHIYQIFKFNNFNTGNAGSWFWMDILVPLILLICITKIRNNLNAKMIKR